MYLTTKSFYQTYLSHLSSLELFHIFQIIDNLLQRYGSYQLTHPEMLKIIKKCAPLVGTLLTLLIQHKKCNKKSVKVLKQLLQMNTIQEYSHFTIASPSKKVNTELEKQFKQQFKKSSHLCAGQVDFSLVQTSEISLQVK
jgi:hypothetical protein